LITGKICFCTKIKPDDEFNGFLNLTLLSGETIKVNPTYIVKKRNGSIVKFVSDITEHMNYYKKVCNKAIETEFIKLNFGETYEIVNNYTARHTGELEKRVILKTIEKN
jgi:2-hydroxychromene-2-carboxylate isomerase